MFARLTALLAGVLLIGGLALSVTRGDAASLAISSGSLLSAARQMGSPQTCNAAAVADTYARSDLSATNFGILPTMEVNSNSLAISRAFVRFDLQSCAIPTGALVTTARLRLTTSSVATASVTYDARKVSAAWLETSLTWANQPAVAASPTASLTVASGAAAGSVYEWNVITDVQDFVTGAATDRGWRISDALEGTLFNRLTVFHSREALVVGVPSLNVTYVN